MKLSNMAWNPYAGQQLNQCGLNTASRPVITPDNAAVWLSGAKQEVLDRASERMEQLDFSALTPSSTQEYNDGFKNSVASAMNRLGYSLADDESLEIGMDEDKWITVSGFHDESKSKALADMLNTATVVSVSGKSADRQIPMNLYSKVFYLNSDYAQNTSSFEEANRRAELIALKDSAADTIQRQTGVSLDIGSLYYDDDGAVQGYPEELTWVFALDDSIPPQTDAEKQMYSVAKSVRHMLHALLDAGYDTIPSARNLNVQFRFSASDFSRESKHVNVRA